MYKNVLLILGHLFHEKSWIRQEYLTKCGEQQCTEKSPILLMDGLEAEINGTHV